MPDPERQRTGRQGGLTSWANASANGTRYDRMGRTRGRSPADDEYWAKKLGFTPDHEGNFTSRERAEIKTVKRAYFAQLRSASAKAVKRKKADKLRALAAKLEAEASA